MSLALPLLALLQAAVPADSAPLPVRELAPGVYAVLGDSGRGSEGRPNAGFIVTRSGVVAIDAQAHPRDGRRMLAAIRRVTRRPVQWLILTHHHPDHHFGAVEFRRAGARVIAHPDTRTLASEGGEDALTADWVRLHGLEPMRGFLFVNAPDRPVTRADTLRLGGETIVIAHPGAAHTAGDLLVWLPRHRVLFAGDLLIEDGVSMLVDGSAAAMLGALDTLDALAPRVAVTGHGAIATDPASLVDSTRRYVRALRESMREAVRAGVTQRRALAPLPPADLDRPVSLPSRLRRNAARVYVEAEREVLGL